MKNRTFLLCPILKKILKVYFKNFFHFLYYNNFLTVNGHKPIFTHFRLFLRDHAKCKMVKMGLNLIIIKALCIRELLTMISQRFFNIFKEIYNIFFKI
jgi:hypothetical protein